MDNDTALIPLSLNDYFRFSCSPGVTCFNECCQELNQYLTPYDILRLKNHLGLPSDLFLKRYTTKHTGPESGLPIITLKDRHGQDFMCPFITSEGCSVYEDRPSSCRSYPLVRVVSRLRETGRITEQYLLLKEAHCRGFEQEQNQTVKAWIDSQGLLIYNQMNDMMMEIIGLKNRLMPGKLDAKSDCAFHMACYDLDTFRYQIFENGILETQHLGAAALGPVKTDDIALLKLGLQWIKQHLLGNSKLDS